METAGVQPVFQAQTGRLGVIQILESQQKPRRHKTRLLRRLACYFSRVGDQRIAKANVGA
jgi:hypothetical protein